MRIGLLYIVLLTMALSVYADDGSFDKKFWVIYGFPLNDVSLEDVQEKLGPAKIFDVPKSHHERAICYRTTNKSDVVVFLSGESGGGNQLLGVSLERANLHNYECFLPKIELAPSFPMGLTLGMSKNEFLMAAGVHFDNTYPNKLRRYSKHIKPISDAELERRYGDKTMAEFVQNRGGMDVSQSLIAYMNDNGEIVKIRIWKVETF